MIKLLKPILPFGVYTMICLAILGLSRISLIAWQWDRVSETHGIWFILIQGVRFDLILLSYLLFIPALLTPLMCSFKKFQTQWFPLVRYYLVACLVFIVFMEIATPSFIDQYDARPNFLFIEYLIYPQEVLSTLWGAYKVQLLVASVLLFFVSYFGWRLSKPLANYRPTISVGNTLILIPLIFLLSAVMARSTFDNRPVNSSVASFSNDPMVNEICLNSGYSLLNAIFENKSQERSNIKYGSLPPDKIVGTIRSEMQIAPEQFTEQSIPTLHVQNPSVKNKRPYNLVIILEESLGAEFVGSLGGRSLTPHLDQLTNQGIWLDHLYATGTRSVRGIEAVVTGFPPTPASSVVKLNKTQRQFFTLAELLREQGYNTSFIYGGESHFDNMRRFFMNNGFEKVIDDNDYINPEFVGTWGVSDEDLFNRAHEEFTASGDKPFFSLVFTSSNHTPFEFPDGKIELVDTEKNTVNNAVKYADYALGNFINKAKTSSYWDNTIILIVADHNSRVYGPETIPIYRFHIPALILGANIKPAVVHTLASQIDLAPTVLSLMGIKTNNPMIGHDLTQPHFLNTPGRALFQYHSTFGFMEGNHLVVLRKGLPADQFKIVNEQLVEHELTNPELVIKALSYSLWASTAIDKHLYHLPKQDEFSGIAPGHI